MSFGSFMIRGHAELVRDRGWCCCDGGKGEGGIQACSPPRRYRVFHLRIVISSTDLTECAYRRWVRKSEARNGCGGGERTTNLEMACNTGRGLPWKAV